MPGSSNFLQFNPGRSNQETDAQYTSDALRTGGAGTDAILPSPVFNKLAYQTSTFVAAFCQMLANKGYAVSDANLATLTALLAGVKTTADITPLIATIAYASSVSFDASAAVAFYLSLTGSVASSSLVNVHAGEPLTFIFLQDLVGGRTFSWPSNVSGYGQIGAAPNSISIQPFIVFPDLSVHATGPMMVALPGGVASALPVIVNVNASGSVSNLYPEIIEKVDTSGGSLTRSLYDATAFPAGMKVTIKKVDSSGNVITIAPASGTGQTIDGQPSKLISQRNNALTIVSDGANWIVI